MTFFHRSTQESYGRVARSLGKWHCSHPCVVTPGGGTNSVDPHFPALKGEIGESFFQPKPGNQRNRLTPDGVGQRGHCKDSGKPQIRFHLVVGQARQGGGSQHFLDLIIKFQSASESAEHGGKRADLPLRPLAGTNPSGPRPPPDNRSVARGEQCPRGLLDSAHSS